MNLEIDDIWQSPPDWLFDALRGWFTPTEFFRLRAVCKSFRDSVYNTMQVLKLDRTVDEQVLEVLASRCKSATSIDLQFCSNISDQSLAHLAALTCLRELNLRGCYRVTDAGLASLVCHTAMQQLELRFCSAISDAGIAHLSLMTGLEGLALCGPCITGRCWATLSSMITLQNLDLDLALDLILDPSRSLVQLATLMQLRRLRLVHYPRGCTPQDIAPLAALTKLTSLCLEHCTDLMGEGQCLILLSGLTLLQHVDLSHCRQLQGVGPLSHFRGLRHLTLRSCYDIGEHGFDALAPSLEQLELMDLRECKNLTESSLCAVLHLPALRCLRLGGDLPSSPAASFARAVASSFSLNPHLAPNLQHLDLCASRDLVDSMLQPLSHLSNLQSLDLAWCDLLRSLQPVAHMTALTELNLKNCPRLANNSANMAYLAPLILMRRLTLWGLRCRQEEPIPGSTLVHLSGMTGLQELVLGPSLHITNADLALLGQFRALAHLNLSECTAIMDLGQLSGLVSLTRLVLSFCTGLSSACVAQLSGLRSLRSLEVAGLPGVSTDDLARAPGFYAAILQG